MTRCPACSTEIEEGKRFCGACGAAASVSPDDVATVAMPHPASRAQSKATSKPAATTSVFDEGRFEAGETLAERYRIVGLLGRGGMGEVYRANDLKLGQPVALKFLPDALSRDPRWLERFHSEVRIARQVSHPNVCRVYDIGEIDGATFLSMEYVDGEDLRGLLRRIGRFPSDKALEMARRLCAGLAAAHDKGVLHRDLKPANIMLDGRGQVMITDFGLAGYAGQIEGREIRNGTPAYMAPEQLAGKEVSVRSDIYALGLVLHEIFTGRPGRGEAGQTPAPGSSTVDLDPAIERVILRCLEADPRKRPASALAVAAALPGGDPLAAALAAGETPSPEMVAAAGETDRIPLWAIWTCVGAIVAGLAAALVLDTPGNALEQFPFEMSTAALEIRAREVVRSLGYTDPPQDSARGFLINDAFRDHASQQKGTYQAQLAKGQPALVGFWYRQSPRYLLNDNAGRIVGGGVVSRADPVQVIPGMAGLLLDPEGRLIEFDAVPPQKEEADQTAQPAREPDWSPLLTAGRLDMSRFQPAAPEWIPLDAFDARAAWIGSYKHAPDVPMRIEAAAWRGRPVFFRVLGPWNAPAREQPPQPTSWTNLILLGLAYTVFGLALLLAWRNYSAGRGDNRGAFRLGLAIFAIFLFKWLFEGSHALNTGWFLVGFLGAVSSSLFWAVIAAALYVALEPHVRRRWPRSMITWTRLLGGGVRDPLVGGHVLIGIAVGVAGNLLPSPSQVTYPLLDGVLDARHMAASFLDLLRDAVLIGMALFFLFFLLRALLRREWIAIAFVMSLVLLVAILNGAGPAGFLGAILIGAGISLIARFGLLASSVSSFVTSLLNNFPLTTDTSLWYFNSTVFVVSAVFLMAAYATYTALAGRPLIKASLLDAD